MWLPIILVYYKLHEYVRYIHAILWTIYTIGNTIFFL